MKTRQVILQADKTVDNNGTQTENIDIADPITSMEIILRATNSTTSNKASPLARCITKIELVDGGKTLWSMPGMFQRGVIAQLTGEQPHSKRSEIASDSQYDTIPMLFGRYHNDTEYAFNPPSFLNPQLKVTWNLAALNAVGVTGFGTGTGRLTIQVNVMEDVPVPGAMLVNREYENFNSASAGDRPVDLPVDRDWRALFVRGYKAGSALNSILTNLKLSFNGGKYIPFDMSIPKFWRKMVTEQGLIWSDVLAQADNATAFENCMAFVISGQVSGRTSGHVVGANNFDNSQTYPYIVNTSAAAQTGAGVWCRVNGTSLENVVLYPFGVLGNPETWLRPQEFANAKLALTQGVADADCNVGLQEVYRY